MSTFAVNQDLSMVKVATLYHLGISRARQIYKCSISKRVTQTTYWQIPPSIENIWGADLADMQLISKLNTKICFLLCRIDI